MVAEESHSRNPRQNAETGVRSLSHIIRRCRITFDTIHSGHSIVTGETQTFGLLFDCVARGLEHGEFNGRVVHDGLRREETVALGNQVSAQQPGCLAQHFVQCRIIWPGVRGTHTYNVKPANVKPRQ
jgi:hypothetical protein